MCDSHTRVSIWREWADAAVAGNDTKVWAIVRNNPEAFTHETLTSRRRVLQEALIGEKGESKGNNPRSDHKSV